MKTIGPIVLLALLALNGCAVAPVAPGMYMKDWGGTSDSAVPYEEGGEVVTDEARIRSITAELIVGETADLRQRQAQQARIPGAGGDQPYRIGPRDILNITVWDHPELTIPAGEFRSPEASGRLVREDGTLFYPFVGVVDVAGLTVEEVRRMLTRRLSRYIEDPQLDVTVASYRSQKAYVVGEVNEPGIQPITDVPLTLLEAISRAGGVTAEADLTNVVLARDGETRLLDLLAVYERGRLSEDLRLRDGDVLNVPDRSHQKVFVMGEVMEPASLLMNKGRMTLAEALGDVGGVDPETSDPGRIYVIRGGFPNAAGYPVRETPRKPVIYHLNAKSPDALLLADAFPLAPRDVVYVDTVGVVRWNRIVTQILPTAQTLFQATGVDFPLFNGGNRL